MVQTFWEKYKVFISGIIGAIIIGLLPVLQPGSNSIVTIAAIVMAVITAGGSWLANNLRGKAQSITGIIISVLTMALPVLFAHGKLDWQNIAYVALIQIAAQFFGYNAPPFKPATYEHNEAIVEAKKIPPIDQVALPPNESQVITQK